MRYSLTLTPVANSSNRISRSNDVRRLVVLAPCDGPVLGFFRSPVSSFGVTVIGPQLLDTNNTPAQITTIPAHLIAFTSSLKIRSENKATNT